MRTAAARRSLDYPILLALSAFDAAGYSVIAPVGPAIARELGVGPAVMGWVVAAFPVGILLGFPLGAALLRRRGSSRVLLASLGVVAAGCLGFVVGSGLAVYLASRFLMGIGSGGLWIGITFGTLERWPGQEYLCMSRVFAAYSVGGLVGPVLGAVGGIRGPFAGYLGLAVVGAGLATRMDRPPATRPFAPDRGALRLPGFLPASIGILFAILALGVIEGVLPLHFASGLGQRSIALMYVGVSFVVAASAASAGRLPPRAALRASTLLVTAGVWLAGATSSPGWWVVALCLAGCGIGLAETASMGVLLASVPAARIVTAMVVWSQLGIIGYLLGPPAAGAAAEAAGFGAVGPVVLTAAVVCLVALRRTSPARP